MAASLICFISSEFFAAILLQRPELAYYIRVASVLVLFQTLFTLTYNLFIGLDSAEEASLTKAIMSIIKASSVPILIIFGFGVMGVFLSHILGYVASSLLGLFLLFSGHYRKLKLMLKPNRGKENFNLARHLRTMIRYGLPLYISSLLAMLLNQYQLILLASYASNIEIGSFKAATNISSILTILIIPITTALLPAFSKIESTNVKENLEKFLNLSVKYSSLIMLPVTILIMVLSKDLVNIIYGQGYSLSATYLTLYISIYLLMAIGYQVIESLFNGIGETGLTLKTYLASLIVFLPLSTLLTQQYKVVGMIVAQVVSSTILTFYGINLLVRRLKINFNIKSQPRIIAISILSAFPIIAFLKISPLTEIFNLGYKPTKLQSVKLIPSLMMLIAVVSEKERITQLKGVERW
ncbi:MAG: oligosaccharide flippase family protein [Candidatus Bathyarchaeia archaeon]